MSNWRRLSWHMLRAAGLVFCLFIVALNVASALGASETFKLYLTAVSLIGVVAAPVVVAVRKIAPKPGPQGLPPEREPD